LVESRIVIPVVVGSSPIGHPVYLQGLSGFSLLLDPEYFAHRASCKILRSSGIIFV
jgi:hypothetical protein